MEAQAAWGLQGILKRLNPPEAEEHPDAFAQAIAGSTSISDMFATRGPFYAVCNGKTQRAIYVRN